MVNSEKALSNNMELMIRGMVGVAKATHFLSFADSTGSVHRYPRRWLLFFSSVANGPSDANRFSVGRCGCGVS